MQNHKFKNNDLEAVSAVFVNYNAGDLLVTSVIAALAQARQVIVIDNASSDTSLEKLASYCAEESRLKIVRNQSNMGFAAGCNIGILHCTEELILFINPDCVLKTNSLARMLNTLTVNPKAGMVGGLLLDPDGTEQGGGRRAVPTPWRSFVRAFGLTKFENRWPRLFYDFHLHEQPLPENPIQVEAISGALMLLRKDVVNRIGKWDEGYFLHCEDLDLCMRFRQEGWDILFDPSAPAVHVHGACSQSQPIFVEWHKHKGMVRFYRKFFRHQYPGLLMWLVIIGVWSRFVIVATIKKFKNNENEVPYLPNDLDKHEAETLHGENTHEPVNDIKQLRFVGVVGATSMVGQALLPLLVQSKIKVIAFSRKKSISNLQQESEIEWREMSSLLESVHKEDISDWVWLAPIKALPGQLPILQKAGAKHIVAVSTTSRFTKKSSSSAAERKFVEILIAAENRLQDWAEENAATWTVLRPTLIYGLGMDQNICIIARFIRRFHFFPILGKASGLRQPIHAQDVAVACKAALERNKAINRTYNISGADKMSYRTMVTRIFESLSIRPRFFPIPLWMFRVGVGIVRVLPTYRTWSSAMVERMNQDMVFDCSDAARDLEFSPQAFKLNSSDLPIVESKA